MSYSATGCVLKIAVWMHSHTWSRVQMFNSQIKSLHHQPAQNPTFLNAQIQQKDLMWSELMTQHFQINWNSYTSVLAWVPATHPWPTTLHYNVILSGSCPALCFAAAYIHQSLVLEWAHEKIQMNWKSNEGRNTCAAILVKEIFQLPPEALRSNDNYCHPPLQSIHAQVCGTRWWHSTESGYFPSHPCL